MGSQPPGGPWAEGANIAPPPQCRRENLSFLAASRLAAFSAAARSFSSRLACRQGGTRQQYRWTRQQYRSQQSGRTAQLLLALGLQAAKTRQQYRWTRQQYRSHTRGVEREWRVAWTADACAWPGQRVQVLSAVAMGFCTLGAQPNSEHPTHLLLLQLLLIQLGIICRAQNASRLRIQAGHDWWVHPLARNSMHRRAAAYGRLAGRNTRSKVLAHAEQAGWDPASKACWCSLCDMPLLQQQTCCTLGTVKATSAGQHALLPPPTRT